MSKGHHRTIINSFIVFFIILSSSQTFALKEIELNKLVRDIEQGCIEKLELRDEYFIDGQLTALGNALKNNRSLVNKISITKTSHSEQQDWIAFLDALKENKSVKSIDLSENDISTVEMTALISMLMHRKKEQQRINKLALNGVQAGIGDLERLIMGLDSYDLSELSLKDLRTKKNESLCFDELLAPLTQSLARNNVNLCKIDISENDISDNDKLKALLEHAEDKVTVIKDKPISVFSCFYKF